MIGTMLTMGAQWASSNLTAKYSKENTAKIKNMQQSFKRESQERSSRRDYEKFRRSCAFQLEIEEISHKERLGNIDQDFMSAIERRAYSDAISRRNYPLNISPYVIKKSVIPICGTQIYDSRKEVFCILTGSNDAAFNKEILPVLDDMLCELISQYWNQSSMHTMCYYPNTWNEKFTYTDECIANLKEILTTPTITVTPFFEEHEGRNELYLKIHMWGVGDGNGVASQIETDFFLDKLPKKYETKQINDIVQNILPHAVCAMAQNIDVYYWTNYYQPPIFPSLLPKLKIRLDNEDLQSISESYCELYKSLALGLLSTDNQSLPLVKEIAEVNLFNFPQRSLNFLRSVVDFSKGESDSSSELIQETALSIYEAKTDDSVKTLTEIDANRLLTDDFDTIIELIRIAKDCNASSQIKELTDIIRRKIAV